MTESARPRAQQLWTNTEAGKCRRAHKDQVAATGDGRAPLFEFKAVPRLGTNKKPCEHENYHGLPLGQDARLDGSPEDRRYVGVRRKSVDPPG